MVILSHIVFACFSSVVEKIWTKNKVCDRKRKYSPNCGRKNLHNANLPINLSAKESDWEGFVKSLFERSPPYKRSQNNL